MNDNALKVKIMKEIDNCIKEKNLDKINEIFVGLINSENVDLKFLKTVLGYTGIYSRELDEWRNLQDFIKKRENKLDG